MDNFYMTLDERHALVEGYLGKTVTLGIDRPIGYIHNKRNKNAGLPHQLRLYSGRIGR